LKVSGSVPDASVLPDQPPLLTVTLDTASRTIWIYDPSNSAASQGPAQAPSAPDATDAQPPAGWVNLGSIQGPKGDRGDPGILPGVTVGDTIVWDGTSWVGTPSPLPPGQADGQVLTWSVDRWGPGTVHHGSEDNIVGLTDQSTGAVLIYDGATDVWTARRPEMSDLADVTDTPQDADVLTWSAADARWVARPTGHELPDGTTVGQRLRWSGTAWTPVDPTALDLVDTSTAADFDVLTWHSGAAGFRAAVRSVPDLVDVTVAQVREGDGLVWSPGLARWQNVAIATKQWVEQLVDQLISGISHEASVTAVVSEPPTDPQYGEFWIISQTPTHAPWRGLEGQVVGRAPDPHSDGGIWVYSVPDVGETRLIQSEQALYTYTKDGRWVKVSDQGQTVGQVPVGGIINWSTNTPPAGWLLCDGSRFDATAYPALYAALGNRDVLPDLRDRFVRSSGPTWAPGTSGQHTTARPRTPFTTDLQGSHTHTGGYFAPRYGAKAGIDVNPANPGGSGRDTLNGELRIDAAGQHSHTITAGGDPETRPDFVTLATIIRAR
jgi:hypothetical protein